MVEPISCGDLTDTLAEVATGAASGPDRARVLTHLAGCDDCRRELDELTRVADEVLLVAPEHEPPAGFESAVLARIAELADSGEAELPAEPSAPQAELANTAEPIWRRRAFRYLALAAVAVAIALSGAGTVWVTTSDERELGARYRDTLEIANGRYFSAAPLLDAAGTQVGHVFLYQGEPSWVFAVLGDAPRPGSYEVVVSTDDGTNTVATCDVQSAGCGAGATIDANIYQVTDVELVAPDGTALTATLRDRSP